MNMSPPYSSNSGHPYHEELPLPVWLKNLTSYIYPRKSRIQWVLVCTCCILPLLTVLTLFLLYKNRRLFLAPEPHQLSFSPTKRCPMFPAFEDPLFQPEYFANDSIACDTHHCSIPLHNASLAYRFRIQPDIPPSSSPDDLSCQYATTKFLEHRWNIAHLLRGAPQRVQLPGSVQSLLPLGDATTYVIQRVAHPPPPVVVVDGRTPQADVSAVLAVVPDATALLNAIKRVGYVLRKEPWLVNTLELTLDGSGSVYYGNIPAYGVTTGVDRKSMRAWKLLLRNIGEGIRRQIELQQGIQTRIE